MKYTMNRRDFLKMSGVAIASMFLMGKVDAGYPIEEYPNIHFPHNKSNPIDDTLYFLDILEPRKKKMNL